MYNWILDDDIDSIVMYDWVLDDNGDSVTKCELLSLSTIAAPGLNVNDSVDIEFLKIYILYIWLFNDYWLLLSLIQPIIQSVLLNI